MFVVFEVFEGEKSVCLYKGSSREEAKGFYQKALLSEGDLPRLVLFGEDQTDEKPAELLLSAFLMNDQEPIKDGPRKLTGAFDFWQELQEDFHFGCDGGWYSVEAELVLN